MKRVASLAIGLGIFATLTQSQSTSAGLIGTHIFNALSTQGKNTIYGTVYGDDRRPVSDAYVELLDDFNSTVGQKKTDGGGRFSFTNLSDGRYILKVRPYGSDYLEQTRQVVLASVSSVRPSEGSRAGGSATEHVDIVLVRDERSRGGPFALVREVIFVQNVPPAAKKLYEDGVAYLREKKESEGFESLKKAIEGFPGYYQALDRLGAEYAVRGATDPRYYEAAVVLLTKAKAINPRGFSPIYGLGWTQYHLGLNAEAIENLRNATTLYGKSPEAHLWLGIALKRAKTLDQAEVSLKRASELSSGKLAEAHWQLAALFSDQRRYKEAADEMEKFIKVAPKEEDTEKLRALVKQLRDKANGK